MTFYEAVGGEDVFRRLVAAFYRGVAEDPVLRPLYPDGELAAAEERLRWFLVQYWGGPTTYGERRGHPRLRARHAGFHIGPTQREAWLRRMRAALDSLELEPAYEQPLWSYLQQTAYAMTNQTE
jgi:hemoglobin